MLICYFIGLIILLAEPTSSLIVNPLSGLNKGKNPA